jgi:lipoprotein-anchoring transpeptidase ErfK/SrfK
MRVSWRAFLLAAICWAISSCSHWSPHYVPEFPDTAAEKETSPSPSEDLTQAAAPQPSPESRAPEDGDGSGQKAEEECPSGPLLADRIVVKKSERLMVLLKDGEVLREYKISLGKNPTGAKIRQGDRKTPEGLYFIEGRNPRSIFHLSLRISYPHGQDVANARAVGAKPGGDIMIHGLPNGVTNQYRMEKDWTNGCIAVTNEEIEEIWELVPDGTVIEILP